MKINEKKESIKLRKEGLSLQEISRRLKVAKSSVSLWVRDIVLTQKQIKNLHNQQYTNIAIEKRRATRLFHENARRQLIVDKASSKIYGISKKELFLMGIALYWAEGSKTRRGMAEFSNSDPRLIKIMMMFFKEHCMVSKKKFRGHIHLHPHLNVHVAERYWSKISGISVKQFFKTSQQHNKASKGKKDTLPYGTFSIYVCSTELFLNIKGWMKGVEKKLRLCENLR